MPGGDFTEFKTVIEREFMGHPVVTSNEYTKWFENGVMSLDHVRHFTVQFSVFSNFFLIAALLKVINANTLASARESKEILMNELGVIYNSGKSEKAAGEISEADKDDVGDPDVVSVEGTVDGGKFRFRAAHLEWLLRFGKPLGLTFNDIGKRRHGTESTLHFTDELARLYGSDDYNVCQGASFAVENWAAAGFWKELISGLRTIKGRDVPDLPLAFFTWHDRIEDLHKEHTWDELREVFDSPEFDEDVFISGGKEMLDGVKVFWDGLNEDRLRTESMVTA